MGRIQLIKIALATLVAYSVLMWIFRLAGLSILGCLVVSVALIFCFVCTLRYATIIMHIYSVVVSKIKTRLGKGSAKDRIYPLISAEQEQSLENTIKISFTGDLILLREAVERALKKDTGEYDFSPMFQHVSDIYKSCDLSIGVFEGPMGGAERGYSTSNFHDGAPLALNFPDAFGLAVKDAGINLVTVANNHLFDVGIEAGMRTLDQLDKIGLNYVGAYRSNEEYGSPKIVDVAGKRIGVLAYTYGQNGFAESFFFDEKTKHYERPIVSVHSKFFKQNVELVKADFARLKAENLDMIIVLPHMGEQFRNKPDKTQLAWCNIFVECGADIILSDHPHHVQPIEWCKNSAGKNVLIVHCPGNFVNSYVQRNGDASMIVNCYINKETMQPISASVVPIYAYCKQNGMWTGLPTVKALEPEIYTTLSRADYRRISEVHKLVTSVALNAPLGLDCRQKEYFTFPNTGFVRSKTSVKSANDIYIY